MNHPLHSIVNPELHALTLKKTPFTKDPKAWMNSVPEESIHEFSYKNHIYIALYNEITIAITHAGHCPCRKEAGLQKPES